MSSHTKSSVLPDGPPAAVDDNLDTTLGAFAARIQRRKKEQEQQDSSAEQAAKTRQKMLLQAMMKIRKALAEVVKLDLGELFMLDFDCDDFQGWPRFTIRLIDSRNTEREYPYFQVNAHDRHSRATIEIVTFNQKDDVVTLFLDSDNDLPRVSLTLKKNVRTYLDIVADTVLSAEKQAMFDHDGALPSVPIEEPAEEEDPTQKAIGAKEDFYEEGIEHDIFEKVDTTPEMAPLNLDAEK